MIADAKFDDEAGRLYALERLNILDTPPETPFENIVQLVQQILHVPICAVSLVDRDRQWFKAQSGLNVCETSRDIAFCAQAIRGDEPFCISDTHSDLRFAQNPLVTGAPFIRSYAGIPLCTPDGYKVGTLCAINTVPHVFSNAELKLLANFARLVESEMQLRQIASTDHLTGALSRRAWTERAQTEVARARRYGRPLALAILDIDKFKHINDAYGHPAGDIVIRHIAEICTVALRQSDLFGRFGGEEFVLMMPETGCDEAFAAVERIRSVFANNPTDLGTPVSCTVSIGVSQLLPQETGLDALLDRADKALYQAKEGGRNRSIVSADPAPAPRSFANAGRS